jgi:hypothetical protein
MFTSGSSIADFDARHAGELGLERRMLKRFISEITGSECVDWIYVALGRGQ